MTSHRSTRVGIVMPVHNRRELTLRCLRSLARIDKTFLHVRIFVIDDGSTDGTADAIAAQFPDVVVLMGDGTLHYAAGTNRGLSAALDWGAEYIVAMNDDSIVNEQFLQGMLAAAKKHPRSIVGALLLLTTAPHRVFQVAPQWKASRGGWQIPSDMTAFSVPHDPFPVETIVGNCVLYPKAAIAECGLMDEKHFPYGWGDAQYLMKMRKAGWSLLIEPSARVWCEPNVYPPALHTVPRLVLKVLFRDQRHPQNLKRQLVARWYSAPSKTGALLAFGVHILKLGAKCFGIGLAARNDTTEAFVRPRKKVWPVKVNE